ncbi:UbiX family flavin prenyltransferase [Sporomusa termitida]|uniref:Flavin prenyltransferase UbiX n=1 Tax=Sporomusa termitida TaxID=2377 RepID=A0A517DVQ7_9FIRM|nr:UbiX family flavin prenyltransferase [Sporomusa termitida]QDR81444.1 putative UbiX-like flavin prenyltransferase [Sporomusa termitida]
MRIIIGITGASGVILGVNLLKALAEQPDCETHLVVTDGAKKTFEYETDMRFHDIAVLADYQHDINNLAAPIASGSFKTDGMVVIPCSMKSLAGIVTGYTDNLLLRAADVCLKERRRVVLVPRELPLSSIHLENMSKAAQQGCIILPPMLTFYNNPGSIQDMVNHLMGKIMMLFDIVFTEFAPWKGVKVRDRK